MQHCQARHTPPPETQLLNQGLVKQSKVVTLGPRRLYGGTPKETPWGWTRARIRCWGLQPPMRADTQGPSFSVSEGGSPNDRVRHAQAHRL